MGVFKGPLNGVGDRPVVAGICMDEVERGGRCGEYGFGEEQ